MNSSGIDPSKNKKLSTDIPIPDAQTISFGEKMVGYSFNPGGSQKVNDIKIACARILDILHSQRESLKNQEQLNAGSHDEINAQYEQAIRSIMSGQMWGVKAATWQY
jgi:hypothetical protein